MLDAKLRRMSFPMEAHLSPMSRTATIVRYFPRKRRKLMGWLLFISLILLNEARGAYVVAQFLKAWNS